MNRFANPFRPSVGGIGKEATLAFEARRPSTDEREGESRLIFLVAGKKDNDPNADYGSVFEAD